MKLWNYRIERNCWAKCARLILVNIFQKIIFLKWKERIIFLKKSKVHRRQQGRGQNYQVTIFSTHSQLNSKTIGKKSFLFLSQPDLRCWPPQELNKDLVVTIENYWTKVVDKVKSDTIFFRFSRKWWATLVKWNLSIFRVTASVFYEMKFSTARHCFYR